MKLVSEAGVGTIAAGVAKAHADAIHVAGHDGGTGASPLSSIQHAGAPWELGLAETHQVLSLNGLRGRVRLQVDGQLKTGRDVAFAALLGADEFGFATAPLVASGCVMMRKCHLNTCPVGIATQDPVLRARFQGTPEHVINYLFFVAEELRALMATLGMRTVDEMIGRVDRIAVRPMAHPKARTLDFGDLLRPVQAPAHREEAPLAADGVLAVTADQALLEGARLSIKYGEPTTMQIQLTNADRAFGAKLAGEIARKHGAEGLPDGTVVVEATGTAGQSFGAFATRGMLIVLEGDANDYVGKGLSGGVLAVRPPARAGIAARTGSLSETRACTAPRRAACSLPVRPASASPSATAERPRSSRAWARTRCEYMTGRRGRRARDDGPQLRRRDERRRRLRAGRRPGARHPPQRVHRRPRGHGRRRTWSSSGPSSRSTWRSPAARTVAPSSRAGASVGSSRSCRTSGGACSNCGR